MRTCLTLVAVCVASAATAADKKMLVPLDTKAKGIAVAAPKDGNVLKPTAITTPDELSKSPLFEKDAAEKLRKEVDFEKEKLVVFAWTGSSRDGLAGELITFDKITLPNGEGKSITYDKMTFADFRYTPALVFDRRQHVRLFVVSKDVRVTARPEPPQLDENSDVQEIPAKDLKIAFPERPGGADKPVIITSAAQLSTSPGLKDAADEIKKRVDFDKQKLVFVAWHGSATDQFSLAAKLADEKFVLAFQVRPGMRVDLYKHARLFVVPKEVGVENAGVIDARPVTP